MTNYKVLVIEDEDLVREGIVLILQVNGYDVYTANNGRKGVDEAKRVIPDLIISDVMMPELDGYGVLEQLRATKETSTIPFLFLTAKADKSDIRQGMSLGADDYLTKPFEIDELIEAVNARLQRASAEKSNAEEIANVKLNELRTNLTFSLPHEFLTPLNGILGLSNIMMNNLEVFSQEEALEMLKEINQSGRRLQRLIENFLLYSKLEFISRDKQSVPEFKRMLTHSSEDVIRDMCTIVAGQNKRSSDIVVNIQDATLLCSSVYLSKIVEELLENAFKFSSPDSRVEVSSFTENYTYTITITDNGRGMTPEQVKNIGGLAQFDRHLYEQQGAGLGLAITQKLVELYNGTFIVESTADKGTAVFVSLPIATDKDIDEILG